MKDKNVMRFALKDRVYALSFFIFSSKIAGFVQVCLFGSARAVGKGPLADAGLISSKTIYGLLSSHFAQKLVNR